MDGRQALLNFINTATSQAQFARDVGCSESHLSLILKGERNPSLSLALRLSRATGGVVPIEAFIAASEAAE